MSLAVTTPKVTLSTDGSTLAFDFSFDMSMAYTIGDEVAVIFQEGESDEATLALTTDYTLSAPNNDYSSGGTVTLVTGSAYAVTSKTITIKSSLDRKSDYELEIGGEFNPITFLKQDARHMRMIQEAELDGTIAQTAITAFYITQLTKTTAKAARESLLIAEKAVCVNNAPVCVNNELVFV